jgi:hypothetical protein
VTLDGGTLDVSGFNQAITSAKLTLNANSTIDFGTDGSEIDFANSSSVSWIGTLTLANWDPTKDKLRFGTDDTGLTSPQLSAIAFDDGITQVVGLDGSGYLVTVPEPSTIALGLMGGLAFVGTAIRRRLKK